MALWKSPIAFVLFAFVAGCGSQGGALSLPGVQRALSGAPARAVPATTANWPQQGMNAAHTGFNTLETIVGIGNVGTLAQQWSFPTGAQISAPILVQNGVAYINSADGYLYAVNVTTGAQVWKFQTFSGGGSQDNPIVLGSHVVVGCLVGGSTQQNGVCALKIASGKLAWSYFFDCNCLPPSGLEAPPVGSGTTLLVPYSFGQNYGGNQLVALSNADGSVLWSYVYPGGNSGGASMSAPAVAGGEVFFGQGFTQSVCSVALSDGAFNWCTGTGDDNNATAVSKGVVYANTLNHGVYAFNASTGSQIWQYTPTAGNYSGQDDPPAIANGKVYVAGVGFSGNLYALKATTGALLFHTSSGSGGADLTDSSPSIANGVAYVECQSGVCAFNAKNGNPLYSSGSSGSSQSSPAIVNGIVYDTCGPNTACAYALPGSH